MRSVLVALAICAASIPTSGACAEVERLDDLGLSNASGTTPSPQAAGDQDLPPIAQPGVNSPSDALAAPDLRPAPSRTLKPAVTDVFGLKELADADPQVGERYQAIRARRMTSVMFVAGAGVGVLAAGILAVSESMNTVDANMNCALSNMFGGKQPCSAPNPDYTAAYVALGISALVGISAAIIWPTQKDVDSAVALWNVRHPDERVALDNTVSTTTATESPPNASAH
jgi:hypothetical protein